LRRRSYSKTNRENSRQQATGRHTRPRTRASWLLLPRGGLVIAIFVLGRTRREGSVALASSRFFAEPPSDDLFVRLRRDIGGRQVRGSLEINRPGPLFQFLRAPIQVPVILLIRQVHELQANLGTSLPGGLLAGADGCRALGRELVLHFLVRFLFVRL